MCMAMYMSEPDEYLCGDIADVAEEYERMEREMLRLMRYANPGVKANDSDLNERKYRYKTGRRNVRGQLM